MRGLRTITVAAGVLSSCVDAISLHNRRDGPARVVGLPIQRRNVLDPVARDRLRRRAGTVKLELDNEETLYFANVTIGTPAQSLRLHIDTGSSDLWVNTPGSALCQQGTDPCATGGTYDSNSSSTFSFISSNFNISYVDGSGASGDYVSDTLKIGGATLSSQQFGIGSVSTASEGILGVGYQANEVQVGRLGQAAYDNVPAKMVTDKLIASNAYSLYLNDLDASTGNILFGGVDTEQFEGTLGTLPILSSPGADGSEFTEFLITLTAVSLASNSLASAQAIPVLLDSGSSLTYLPNALTSAIYEVVGAQFDSSQGVAYVPCSLSANTSTLDYTFTGPTISVPLNELVLELGGRPMYFESGERACIFGIAPSGAVSGASTASLSVLGDTFLRSAYVVYDLANNEISLAQTRFNASGSSILEIGTGDDAVPGATKVAGAPTAVSSGGGGNSGNENGNVGGGGGSVASSTASSVAVAVVAVGWKSVGVAAAAAAGMLFTSL